MLPDTQPLGAPNGPMPMAAIASSPTSNLSPSHDFAAPLSELPRSSLMT